MPPPHPSNNGDYRPTPPESKLRAPTEGELVVYERGVHRFPFLSICGSFRTWPLENLFSGVIIDRYDFNCFAWSVGHTDRWIQGSTVEAMNALYRRYHFEECGPAEADVDVFRIIDAPPTLMTRSGRPYQNSAATVQHAQRRDRPQLDASPHQGCSSKQGDMVLIAHNRRALEDTRPWNSRQPVVTYGSIYQHWRRTLEHPSFPGKRGNLVPATGNYPNDPIFASGYGRAPPGHPGNTVGLPDYDGGDDQGPQQNPKENRRDSKKPGGMFPGLKSGKSREAQKAPKAADPRPRRVAPGPAQTYAKVSAMRPHDPIPLPTRAAQDAAVSNYKSMLKSSPGLVKEFEARFYAWQKSWYAPGKAPDSNAKARCDVPEFGKLLEMGPRVVPLVIYRMLDRHNFTAVFLYNALERDTQFLIDPYDVLNFLVLQRQNNLIIDVNQRRRC